jgi:lipoyl(octanoyl) transferase
MNVQPRKEYGENAERNAEVAKLKEGVDRAGDAGGPGVRGVVRVIDLGVMEYRAAYQVQLEHLEEVLAGRGAEGAADVGGAERKGAESGGEIGRILLVEHPAVITVGRRPGAQKHLVATPEFLAARGIDLVETDRGGDITYHGPGQLVCYPIVDLNRLKLGLHGWMRLLEEAVIAVCRDHGLEADREEGATGVWVRSRSGEKAKICAMGVRVKRWITMHGLALNVTTNLEHFGLIVPCGLVGRPVTSLERELGAGGKGGCPPMAEVKRALIRELEQRLRT